MTETTTEIGRYGEELAARYLKKKGYKILERNYRAGRNELDIIAENKEYTIFVEVKARSEHKVFGFDFGNPSDAVTIAKQKRTIAAAKAYLYKRNGDNEHDRMIRFDVIEVIGEGFGRKIRHIENAFEDV